MFDCWSRMDAQLKSWKLVAERLWRAQAFDHREAAVLAAEIAHQCEEPTLRQRAVEALPSLRAACVKGADARSKAIAHRRFGAMRDCLHALSGPRFGKRRSAEAPTPEEYYRRLLRLPLSGRLSAPEITRAYKRAAKQVHPDAGGNHSGFLELATARDALMKSL
jgi:hypothetical protein